MTATLPATQLFGHCGIPLTVRDYALDQGPLTVTAEAVTMVFSLSGYGQLQPGGDIVGVVPTTVDTGEKPVNSSNFFGQ